MAVLHAPVVLDATGVIRTFTRWSGTSRLLVLASTTGQDPSSVERCHVRAYGVLGPLRTLRRIEASFGIDLSLEARHERVVSRPGCRTTVRRAGPPDVGADPPSEDEIADRLGHRRAS